MLPCVITHTENEIFHPLQKSLFLFNLIGLVIEPHVFHRSTLLSCDCLHDQVCNGLAGGISRVAQRCSYEGRRRTVGEVDSVHVNGKNIEWTLVEGAIGVVECAECPRHSVAIKVATALSRRALASAASGVAARQEQFSESMTTAAAVLRNTARSLMSVSSGLAVASAGTASYPCRGRPDVAVQRPSRLNASGLMVDSRSSTLS